MSTTNSKENGLDYVTIEHQSGKSSCVICLYGCTVTSFKSELEDGMTENLFLSEKAVLDGSKAIRGGVPLVFPQFGGGELPNHGFARTSTWEYLGEELEDDKVSGIFQLKENETTKAMWPHSFTLTYKVTLHSDCLVTALSVENTGSEPFPFQALLHTYYAIADVDKVAVHGLDGITYIDQLQESKSFVHEKGTIQFNQEFDSIFCGTSEEIFLSGISPTRCVALTKHLSKEVNGEVTKLPCDLVVWNPWIEKSKRTGDLGDEEYKSFFCAEPGTVSEANAVSCSPGEKLTLQQDIHVIKPFE